MWNEVLRSRCRVGYFLACSGLFAACTSTPKKCPSRIFFWRASSTPKEYFPTWHIAWTFPFRLKPKCCRLSIHNVTWIFSVSFETNVLCTIYNPCCLNILVSFATKVLQTIYAQCYLNFVGVVRNQRPVYCLQPMSLEHLGFVRSQSAADYLYAMLLEFFRCRSKQAPCVLFTTNVAWTFSLRSKPKCYRPFIRNVTWFFSVSVETTVLQTIYMHSCLNFLVLFGFKVLDTIGNNGGFC